MSVSYGIRLACLCLEIIFLVNLVVSIIAIGFSRQAGRVALTMLPRRAARLFLISRLLPFASSLCIASLCIPSYLRYEQNGGGEQVGLSCLLMSILGLVLCVTTVYKIMCALAQSYRIERRFCLLPRVQSPVAEMRMCAVEEDRSGAPVLALVGVLRPMLIVSRRLLQALTVEQLEAALFHEKAHQISRDNLKRLAVAVTPGIFPFISCFRSIERDWERYAELAADDYAARGRVGCSVAMAEALIQVARLGNGNAEKGIYLASSLSAHDSNLAMRVNRLMAIDSSDSFLSSGDSSSRSLFFAIAAFAVLLVFALSTLRPFHGLLESLLH